MKNTSSRLFVTTAVENKDDLEEVYTLKCYYLTNGGAIGGHSESP